MPALLYLKPISIKQQEKELKVEKIIYLLE